MVMAYVALGSNLGDRRRHVEVAVARLGGLPWTRVRRVSSLYDTAPVGPGAKEGGQRRYLNGVAELDTRLGLGTLHALLRGIERTAGRPSLDARQRWAARTLDLDLLLYGDDVIETPTLSVPHPRMHERVFVLAPLAELAPDLLHPVTGRSVLTLLEEVSNAEDAETQRRGRGAGERRFDE